MTDISKELHQVFLDLLRQSEPEYMRSVLNGERDDFLVTWVFEFLNAGVLTRKEDLARFREFCQNHSDTIFALFRRRLQSQEITAHDIAFLDEFPI